MSSDVTASLFPADPIDALVASEKAVGPFAGVAIEQSIDRLLDYSIPPRLVNQLRIGQRVKVPLGRGNKPVRGFVISISDETKHPKIKNLLAIEDERVLVDEGMLRLACWMSRYYCTPLGAVIDAIVPAAVKKRIGIGYASMVTLAKDRDEIQATLEQIKAPKRRAILAHLLQLEPGVAIELNRLAGESGATPATVRKLSRLGLIHIRPQVDLPKLTDEPVEEPAELENDRELNPEQRAAFDQLVGRLAENAFSVNLLHGVTGSGKTEIYLQCIRKVIEAGKQAIVLVPEIALTPQTVNRFKARFARVAILHSGLTATQRHRFWQRIAEGRADVVVGARSAIFAPTPNLGMIVVDEEHESSYKSDTAPRYNARDVAIKRARLANIPVMLGSATPSLEGYARATLSERPDHHYLELPKRVQGLSMPHIELVDLRNEARLRKGVHLLSQRLEYLLRNTIDAGQQAIVLLNRRGYSSFIFCSSCQEPIHCRYCDATMTYHRSAAAHAHNATSREGAHTGQMHCHYCLAVDALPMTCPACGHKLVLFGLGTQRVEEELTRKFPDVPMARVDSDSMHGSRDYEKLLHRFAAGEIKVLLGTQMIAKGLHYPNVTLVGVISGDTALSLPDFRSAERTFQLITQVAGRAGRGKSPGRVVLQTFMPDDPTIRAALQQDFAGFAKQEFVHRRELRYPPFARMVRIVLRDQNPDKLGEMSDALAGELHAAIGDLPIGMRGPSPCAIGRIAGYFRQQIVLSSPKATALQSVLAVLRSRGDLRKSDRIAIDVDPLNLL
ncbi:MAG: primosomal protein N' [Phycisphaerae bacterium]|nr:primosomal protein N' [Phycisphaerae bacterium]